MNDVSMKHKLIAGGLTLCLFAGGGLALQRCANGEEFKSGLPVEKLVIREKGGKEATFNVEIASKPIDLHVGLMFRKEMPKDHGMLFEFAGDPREQTFWMKDTLIALDMLFVSADGHIVNLHRNAHPQDLTPIPSGEPVTAVIELNAGVIDDLGIKIGDRVVHPFFKEDK
jgi:uncharacterized protein